MICLVRFIMVTSVVTGVELLGYVSTVVKIGKLFLLIPIQISTVWGRQGVASFLIFIDTSEHIWQPRMWGGIKQETKKEKKV